MSKISNNIGDKFESKDFLGFVFITSISDTEIHLTYQHVSGEDYHDKISIDNFNHNKYCGNFYGFISN